MFFKLVEDGLESSCVLLSTTLEQIFHDIPFLCKDL